MPTPTATTDLYDDPELLADLAGPDEDAETQAPVSEVEAPQAEPVAAPAAPPPATCAPVRPELAHLAREQDRAYAEELIADGEDPGEAARRAICASDRRLQVDRSYQRLVPHRGADRGAYLAQATRRRVSVLEVPGDR